MQAAGVATVVVGLLVIVGGLVAFLRAGSRASLISAAVLGGLLELSGWMMVVGQAWAVPVGALAALGLTVVMGYRYFQTHKIMPGAVFAAVGLVLAVWLGQIWLISLQ